LSGKLNNLKMKKIDLDLLLMSTVLIAMAIRSYILDGEFVRYLFFGVLLGLQAVKGVFSKSMYKIIRVTSLIAVVLYCVFYI
jgi:hypothetical protein